MKRQYTRRTDKPAKVTTKRRAIKVDSATLKPETPPVELPRLSPTIRGILADVVDLLLS